MKDHITRPAIIPLPKRANDITGQRFGRIVAVGPVKSHSNKLHWLCQCDCGNNIICAGDNLRNEHTKSCGCLKAEVLKYGSIKHGMSHTRIHNTWTQMRQRCGNQNDARYSDYGARGIKVFSEWQNSFESFYDYVSKLPHYGEPGYTIDRINNDGNYEPGNIRWATIQQQNLNTRQVVRITYNGRTQNIMDWAKEYGIDSQRLYRRIWNGWSMERALTQPVRKSTR